MATKAASTPKSKSTKLTARKRNLRKGRNGFRSGFVAFASAFAGVAFAIPLLLSVTLPAMRKEITTDVASAMPRTVQVTPAVSRSDFTPAEIASICTQPSSVTTASAGGQVLGASTTQPTTPSTPSGSSTTTVFVKKLVSGVFTTTGSISNTGPGSNNVITTNNTATTTVTNTNDVNVSVSNHQDSSSGDATVTDNTTGGSATSGHADNQNQTNFDLSINN